MVDLLRSWFGFGVGVPPKARQVLPRRSSRRDLAQEAREGEDRLIAFYLNDGENNRGRTLEDLWEYDYDRLEAEHDYIQWMFPNDEKSMFNPWAPAFPKHVQESFRQSPEIRRNIRKSFDIYAGFLGFETTVGRLQRSPDFKERAANWLQGAMNHNFLRCTRVLKCLWLCGERELAHEFRGVLLELAKDGLMRNKRTLEFWLTAIPSDDPEDTAARSEPEPEPYQAEA
jgi:hypothetical protein